MATQIQGPIRLPDGSQPAHGRVIFTPRSAQLGATVVTKSAVIAPIVAGAISITLEAEVGGTSYAVAVEHWSEAEARLVSTALPDVVPTGAAGPFAIEDLAAVQVPPGASSSTTFKRGDTISLGGQWVDEHFRPADLTGQTISAAMLGPDGVIRPLAVVMSEAASGLIEATMPASATALLPLGGHQVDFKVSNGVRVGRTQTGFINIIEEVTP